MNPFVLFLLAIVSPMLLAAVILIPPYAGITAASYAIYFKSGAAHPLSGKFLDAPYMIDVYTKLFSNWSHHMADTSLLTYTLPLLLIPILGIMLSIWLLGKVARKLKDIFQHGVSI